MPRACIFCGRPGGLTREHAWPNWISEVLPHLKQPIPRTRFTRRRTTGEVYDRRERLERPLDKRVQQVCGPCNHEWMSNLEGRVRPILSPMLLGQPTTLGASEQALVAFWAVKTAMVLEYTQPTTQRGIPQVHRDYLYHRRQAPPTALVSLAAYNGPSIGPIYVQTNYTLQHVGLPLPPDDARPNAYAASFGIGELVFEILGYVIPANVEFVEGPATILIWPDPRPHVNWPPRYVLGSERELMELAMNLMSGRDVPGDPIKGENMGTNAGAGSTPQTSYRDETVQIGALAATVGRLEGLTFENCLITGPAILFIHPDWKIEIDSPVFEIPGGDIEAVFWEVDPYKQTVIGAIAVKDCVFRNCRFQGIGLASVRPVLDHIRNSM
jgi:hypothetical protein